MNILVVGKAKSGTTIISKTIQKSAGIPHYHLEKRKVQFFENAALEQPLLVKLLFEDWARRSNFLRGICLNEGAIRFGRVVLITRDPRDVMVSLLVFRAAQLLAALPDERAEHWLARLAAKERAPHALSLAGLFRALGEASGTPMALAHIARSFLPWFDFARALGRRGLHVLRYEDFIGHRLEGLESYLGFRLTEERSVDAYVNTPRTRGVDNWKEFLLPADLALVDRVLGGRMRELGYTDWQLERPAELSPEFYTAYVRRVIQTIRSRATADGTAARQSQGS